MEAGWNSSLTLQKSAAIASRFTAVIVSLGLTGCPSKPTGASPNEVARQHQPMKVVMTLTGGFTGVGGRWELESDTDKKGLKADRLDELNRLVSQARAEGFLGKDFTTTASDNKKVSGSMPGPVPADMQTYELAIDGQRTKWTEPSPAGAAAAPAIVESLKDWMLENAERQPYRSR